MSRVWVKPLLLAAAVALFTAGRTEARTVELLDGSDNPVGWTATIPDAGDNGSVNISFVRSAGGVYYFNKTATFTNNSDPVIVEFVKTSASAPTLAIGTEGLTNSSGADWTGFRTIISNASATGGAGGPAFAFDAAGGLNGFGIDPFTTFAFSNNGTELDVAGGTVANGDTWSPGSATSGGLVILQASASTSDRFILKEIPLTGGNTGPGPAIPLPAAAWTGMSTLVGLALVSAGRKAARKA